MFFLKHHLVDWFHDLGAKQYLYGKFAISASREDNSVCLTAAIIWPKWDPGAEIVDHTSFSSFPGSSSGKISKAMEKHLMGI